MKKILVLLLIIAVLLSATARAQTVYTIDVSDVVAYGTSEEIREGIQEAKKVGASAVLIRLNTPGGDAESTDEIISYIENSPLPVVTYVPSGARAFSAGSFILLSGNIAAMANGTATGAATPIAFGTSGISAVDTKIVNAFAARMKGIAEKRGKNVSAAGDLVLHGTSFTAREALEVKLIDLTADDENSLLSRIDSKVVSVNGVNVTLHTSGAQLYVKSKGLRITMIEFLSNPLVVFLLFIIGIYGIIFGLASPGTYIPETLGAVCLILALYGMGVFSANAVGILLIIAGVVLAVVDLFAPTHGVLTASSIVCLVLGALLLPKSPASVPSMSGMLLAQEWWNSFLITVIISALASAAFFVFALSKVIKLRRKKATTGTDELLGMVVKAETDITPEGTVKVRGEIWSARIEKDGEHVKKGETAKITGRDGFTLIVKKDTGGG